MLYASSDPPNRVVRAVISGGLGDCLLATPFVRHLKQSGHYDRLICVVPRAAAEIFDRNAYVDSLIPCVSDDLFLWGVPEIGCDVFSPYVEVSPPSSLGPQIELAVSRSVYPNLTDRYVVRQVAEHHGFTLDSERLDMFTSDEDEEWADTLLMRWKDKPVVLINTSSGLPEKTLPRATAQEVVNRLRDTYVVLEFPDEAPLSGSVVLDPMPRLRQSAALFRRLDAVITVDSFPGHLAAAMGTPAVVIFGPSNPLAFGHDANHNIRAGSCPPCADTPRREACKRSACLDEVTAEEILKGVAAASRRSR